MPPMPRTTIIALASACIRGHRSVDGLDEDRSIPPPRLGAPSIFESQPQFLKDSINRERWFWGYDTPEKYETNVRAYYRMISGIDKGIAAAWPR